MTINATKMELALIVTALQARAELWENILRTEHTRGNAPAIYEQQAKEYRELAARLKQELAGL
jgi:hypothetical protein